MEAPIHPDGIVISEPDQQNGAKGPDQDASKGESIPVKYMVKNAPYYSQWKDIRKFLNNHGVDFIHNSVSKLPKSDHFYVRFENQAKADKFEQVCKDHKLKGHQLEAEQVEDTIPRHERLRLKLERAEYGANNSGRDAPNDADNDSEQDEDSTLEIKTAADVVAPWRDLPYEKQMGKKMRFLVKALKGATKLLRKENKREPWVDKLHKYESCVWVDGIKSCPLEHRLYYRNKTELSFGYSEGTSDSKPALGFFLGKASGGDLRVGAVDESCITASKTVLWIVSRVSSVLKEFPELRPWSKTIKQGFWRNLLVRESFGLRQCMVVFQIFPGGVPEETIVKMKLQMRKTLLSPESPCPYTEITGIGYDINNNPHSEMPSDGNCALDVDFGTLTVTESLCGMRFQVGHRAFFQVNTVMAESLFETLQEFAGLNQNTALLDVCCGTGVIGLILSKHVSKVVGIEIISEAVKDAERNAVMNNIVNATFLCGPAEEKISEAIKLIGDQECVAIVDPPRAGLHVNVVKAIRANPKINRVIYVCCGWKSFPGNALNFCRSQSRGFPGAPFRPAKAYGADLFPNTPHVELIVVFSRSEGIDDLLDLERSARKGEHHQSLDKKRKEREMNFDTVGTIDAADAVDVSSGKRCKTEHSTEPL